MQEEQVTLDAAQVVLLGLKMDVEASVQRMRNIAAKTFIAKLDDDPARHSVARAGLRKLHN